MLVKQAKAIARQWVNENADNIPGFYGAFFHGSINRLADTDSLPASSDVDVMIVLDAADPPDKLGKFRYEDVLLEISYLPREQIQSAEMILARYNLTPSFSVPSVIADPTGQLTALQAAVAKDFTKRRWVEIRCEDARKKVLRYIHAIEPDEPFHMQVIKLAFGAGLTTHVLLVAGLKNPTVRKRYVAARDLLADYGYLDFQETLLELLGCAQMREEQIAEQLIPLAAVFDATSAVIKTAFPFASDISADSRPIAIDGTRTLIERGYHRETVFWLVVTYARCMTILAADAPEMQREYESGFRDLLSDLGITSYADIQQRCDQITNRLPNVWQVAEAIMDANPEIDA